MKEDALPEINRPEVEQLLAEVGTLIAESDFERTLEELGVDSLARAEIATRLQERFGVEIKDELPQETTPGELIRLVSGTCNAAWLVAARR